MKVIQVPRRFVRSDWGGTETVILETGKRLLEMGHETEILCPNALANEDREVMEGVQVTRYPYFYPYWGLRTGAAEQLDKKGGNLFSFQILRALNTVPGLELIHLHTGKRLGGIGRHVARKRKIPYIVSLHGGVFDVPDAEAKTWTEPTQGAWEWGKALGMWVGSRRVLDDAAAILCVGEKEREETQRRLPDTNVLHLPNGVDSRRFSEGDGSRFRENYGIPATARVLLTVGRIDPQKNQLFAVDVFSELRKEAPDLHLLLIGHVTNDDYHQRLKRAIQDHGVADGVTLVCGLDAAASDLVDAYHAADIFLLPSIHEPFGIVILEAWAAGLPVLASRVGGIPSVIEEGRDGALFTVNDRADCIRLSREMLENRERCSQLSEAGRRKAEDRYDWSAVTKRLVGVYEEVVRENPLRP